MRKLSKGAKISLVLVPPLLVVVILLVATPYVFSWAVQSQARSAGVQLEFQQVDAGWNQVTLRGVEGKLLDVEGVQWRARELRVRLDWLRPTYASADGVAVRLVGSPVTLLRDGHSWLARYSTNRSDVVPLDIRSMRLSWYPRDDSGAAWLRAEGVELRRRQGKGSLRLGSVLVAERAVGAGVVRWKRGGGGTNWEVMDARNTRLVSLFLDDERRNGWVKWETLPVPQLASSFGLPWFGKSDTTTTGRIEAHFEEKGSHVSGKFRVTLDGYVPAHPPALDGVLHGRTTKLAGHYDLQWDKREVKFSQAQVKAGALLLAGGGRAGIGRGYVTLALSLNGRVPCSLLAGSAIRSGVRGALGRVLAAAAGAALQGDVAVHLDVRGDTRRPNDIVVQPTLGVGCGLRLGNP